MSNKQVTVYGILESTNDLRKFLWDTSILRNLWNLGNLVKYFTVAWPGSGTRNKVSFSQIY